MTHAVDISLSKVFPATAWLFNPAAPDLFAELTEALGDDWMVCRETDCEGETLIIAISAIEADRLPSIVLYEKGGLPHVATVVDDEWCGERTLDTVQQAIGAFIAMARTARISG